MKKLLLLASAVVVALSANADVLPKAAEMDGEDITPAGYKFNTYGKPFIGAPDIAGTSGTEQWALGNNWFRQYSQREGFEFGDGLIGLAGPNYSGGDYKKGNFEQFNAGCKIIDMGGTCGKVLAMNFPGSDFKKVYEKLCETPLEIGEIPAGFTTPNWWLNPEVTARHAGIQKDGEAYMPMRVRIELNIYSPTQGSEAGTWKAFMQNDNGNVVPMNKGDDAAKDIEVSAAEFAYRWCEKSDDPKDAADDTTWEDGDIAATWNPERWMVYEWDFNAPDIEKAGDPFCNIKLKNEIKGNVAKTVLVRSINVYIPTNESREYVYQKRPRTWNFYTVGKPDESGLKSVFAQEAFDYSVNGSTVSFSAPAQVYTLSGAKVAEGTTANLSKGIYVVRCGAKATKVVVK